MDNTLEQKIQLLPDVLEEQVKSFNTQLENAMAMFSTMRGENPSIDNLMDTEEASQEGTSVSLSSIMTKGQEELDFSFAGKISGFGIKDEEETLSPAGKDGLNLADLISVDFVKSLMTD